MPRSPNLVLILADDQRHDTLRAAGNLHIHTPHLDALADRGTVFTAAHIAGGTCGAICMPSRAMLHTGRTLFHIEREGQNIPPEHRTLGETFRAAGYETFVTGKWHNGTESLARSFSAGDEIFFGGMYDHWNVPLHAYDPTGRYVARLPQVRDWEHSNEVVLRSGDHVHAGVHSTEIFAEAALRFLRSRDTRKPFFLYVPLMAPHDPRTMPDRFRALYRLEDIPLPPNVRPEPPFDPGTLEIRDEKLAAYPRRPDEVRRHLLEYYAMISHLDDAVGRILEGLRAGGHADDTIVVFSSDNGLAVGCHGLMGKQNLYEHSIRVPLVMAGPGIPAGERCEAWVYLHDLFPTLCELAGLAAPDTVEARSFAGCLTRPDSPHQDALYLAYTDRMRGVKQGRHKLIEYVVNGRRHTELFDLQADPLELRNLADRPEHRDTVVRLRAKLRDMRDAWEDRRHPAGERFWSGFTA